MLSEKIIKVEELVSELYGPNCSQESLQYCQDVQNKYIENNNRFEDLFQSLINTRIPHFKFWIIDTLIKIINQKYSTMTKVIRDKFRQSLLNLFNYNIEIILKESFIINKYCLLFNNFIFYDFPENNNTIFNDILNNIYNTKELNIKINKLNLLLQIFNIFDEEFIKFRYIYNDIQINRSSIIKAYMRNNTIPNIILVIKAILENESYINNIKIIQKSIIIISQLIDWVPFEFFIDILKIILGNLIKRYEYFNQCCYILYSIVKKGMEPKLKRNILNEIHINDLINNLMQNGKKIEEITVQKISDIINLIGYFIIENFEYTKELIKSKNNNGNDEINDSFNWSCNELKYYFYFIKEISFFNNKISYKELLNLFESFEEVILYLKSNDIILIKNSYILDYLKELFNIIGNSLKIPKDEYSLEEDLTEYIDEDNLFLLRKEFIIIFRNCYNIPILKEFLIDFILNNLLTFLKININQNINSINKYDIEFCLFLINTLQESMNSNDISNKDYINLEFKLNKIYDIFYSFPFTKIKNADYILLSYYDNINKGIIKIINNPNLIKNIIQLYISDEGIFYNGKKFCKIKIVNNFDRFMTKIKQVIGKKNIDINYNLLINIIKESIIKLILDVKNTKNFELLKNYSLLFHSYGTIISMNNNSENIINNYNEALKLFINMPNEFSNSSLNDDICELILNCLIHFIHSVDTKKYENIKKILSEFFDVFIGSYCIKVLNNKNNSLLLKYIILLQRVLILIDINSLKYIEHFFINDYFNSNIISECLRLLQNTISILKKESKSLIKKTMSTFFQFISKVPFPKDDISEENKIIININLDLVKIFNNICLDIPEVFFENGGIDNINYINLIKSILNIGYNFKESLQRRVVIKSMNNLCKYFNINKNIFKNQKNFIEIISLVLDGLFLIYSKNGKKDAIDIASSVEISQCHLFLICLDENIYSNYLMKYLNQNEIRQFINIINNVNYKKLKPSEELLNFFNHITVKLLNTKK